MMGRKNRCKLKRKVKRKILKKNRNINTFLIKKNIFKDRDVSDIFKNLRI